MFETNEAVKATNARSCSVVSSCQTKHGLDKVGQLVKPAVV